MSVDYLDIADIIAIAQAVTGLDMQTVINVTNIDLADSALHAPAAGFGDDDFYRMFVEINKWTWDPMPTIDDAEAAVLAVASGEWDESHTAQWLRGHLRPA